VAISRLLIAAGRPADAWTVASQAALEPGAKRSDHDQIAILEMALHALDLAQIDGGETAARLRLRLARLYRSRGNTTGALLAITAAVPLLTGPDLIDGLGFAAAVADDRQHPQEAEGWVALAELEAAAQGSLVKLGSLLTFHGRELSRLGFAPESEAVLAKGNALLEVHGSEVQRFYGALNQAWVDLDQGQMKRAESRFAMLTEKSERLEGGASHATQEAYWARALFGVGRPDEALAAIERAVRLAEQAPAPEFIARLAQAEGGILFEQWDFALEGADRALALALASLPAWENMCRYLRARALAGAGRLDEAREEVEAAFAATPPGSNGIRYRSRIEELSLELADIWDQRRAEDLTDRLLQSRWLGAAADLMTARAAREKDSDLAAEAAALAMQIGNPAQAAKAIHAGNLWQDPIAAPVISALRSMIEHLPEGWTSPFVTDPSAQTALASEVEAGPEETALLRSRIEEALEAAGLGGDMVLSPAQRQAAGLVRRRPPRRRRGPLAWVAGGLGVAVLAVGAAVLAVNVLAPPQAPPVTTASTTTTTTIPSLEQTPVAAPETGITGSVGYRGDPARTGVASGGFREATGRYWGPIAPGGLFVTAPVAYGRYVFVATEEDIIYVIEQTNGRINLVIDNPSGINSPLAVGQPSGESDPVLVFGGDDGVVYGYSALRPGPVLWEQRAGLVEGAPLTLGDAVYVGSTDGYLYAFSLAGGDQLWRYPAEEPTAGFEMAPAYFDGTIYAADTDGLIHMIAVADGTPVCEPVNVRFEVSTNPVIIEGAVFVGHEVGLISVFAPGTCGSPPTGYSANYPVSRPVRLSPAVTADSIYVIEDRLLLAMSLDPSLWTDAAGAFPSPWDGGPFSDEQIISTPPVLADGVLYLGTVGGGVHAVDAATGEHLWEFSIGAAVRGEPLVVAGAVFAANSDGQLWAIAGE
jgi:outer membrane protein assembly factor BamB/tetratricopeptide (TPR) repeat protein